MQLSELETEDYQNSGTMQTKFEEAFTVPVIFHRCLNGSSVSIFITLVLVAANLSMADQATTKSNWNQAKLAIMENPIPVRTGGLSVQSSGFTGEFPNQFDLNEREKSLVWRNGRPKLRHSRWWLE